MCVCVYNRMGWDGVGWDVKREGRRLNIFNSCFGYLCYYSDLDCFLQGKGGRGGEGRGRNRDGDSSGLGFLLFSTSSFFQISSSSPSFISMLFYL